MVNKIPEVIKYNAYRNSNIGIYLNSNDDFVFVPPGFEKTKAKKISMHLRNNYIHTSIANTRLLGILMDVNNYGIILPKISTLDEVEYLKKTTKMNIKILDSKYTAIGNIICINDSGGIISPLVTKREVKQIQDIMGVEIIQMKVSDYHQVGAMIVANSYGGIIHPGAGEKDVKAISKILKVNLEHSTINNGVKFVSSGILINNKSIIVGELTSGSEIITINRSFSR